MHFFLKPSTLLTETNLDNKTYPNFLLTGCFTGHSVIPKDTTKQTMTETVLGTGPQESSAHVVSRYSHVALRNPSPPRPREGWWWWFVVGVGHRHCPSDPLKTPRRSRSSSSDRCCLSVKACFVV